MLRFLSKLSLFLILRYPVKSEGSRCVVHIFCLITVPITWIDLPFFTVLSCLQGLCLVQQGFSNFNRVIKGGNFSNHMKSFKDLDSS